MKSIILTFLLVVFVVSFSVSAQNQPENSRIDIMLIKGDFKKVIDTCTKILAADSLNSEVYYKMGLAYQNLLSDDKSLDCFLKASAISPENINYSFTVAKSFYNKGKNNKAKPILLELCAADSMNWTYAYYLTGIYMQEGKYEESLKIYERFYKQDSVNYVLMDKIGFACLRKGDTERAIEMFNHSLAINQKNINAMKNLSYLYAISNRIDTAIQLLTNGIQIDPADMDLYVRRAALNFSINYNKRALNDYLTILSSGDSSVLYLKRAGIGYSNNLQPKEANIYLLKAYQKDTSDLQVLSFLARNYQKTGNLKKSAFYYTHITDILSPFVYQLGLNYILLAEVYKSDNRYGEAISAYLKSQEYRSDVSIYVTVAILYDDKLKDIPKAIQYYELFLNRQRGTKDGFSSNYIEAIKKRYESLKKIKQQSKQP